MNDLLRARMAAQYGALSVADAYCCGYTRLSLSRAVSEGELIRVRRGAFVDAKLHAAATPEGRYALAAQAIAREPVPTIPAPRGSEAGGRLGAFEKKFVAGAGSRS